jgi:exosortase A
MTRIASWRNSLLALLFAFALIIACYWSTAVGMVEIWERSGTFTHAFLVLPISLWLVWRLRGALAQFTPSPAPWMAVPLLLVGVLWLLGELVAVNVVTQFALVSMLVLSVPMLLGMPLARAITFPLLFLYFCVPFGEFVMPRLMQWTADITVLGVRLSGVPVYQEGLQFVIPSGHWSVVEACSGIRYLIASVCIGVLFAYLNYSSLKRRVLFVIAAIFVPLIANWIRAYGIVMLGHVSGNQLATGFDHLIYGWVFFGIVMMLLFMVGMRWQQPEVLPTFNPVAVRNRHSLLIASLLLGAALLLPRFVLWQIERSDAGGAPEISASMLRDIGEWKGQTVGFNSWQPAFTQAATTFKGSYRKGEQQAGLYIAYYRHQDSLRKLVSSANVLVPSGDPYWAVVDQGSAEANDLQVRTASLRGGSVGAGGEPRLRVWQWYWVDGKLTASDLKGKLLTLVARLTGRGDDGAIVVLFAPEVQPGEADATLLEFSAEARKAVDAALAQAREQR